MKIYDITKPLSSDLIPWPGEKAPEIQQVSSFENGDEYNVTELKINVHIGTHIDAPKHFINNANSIDKIPLSKMIGETWVIEVDTSIDIIDKETIGRIWKENPTLILANKILFKTKNSSFEFGKNRFDTKYVGLDSSGAQALVERGIEFVGIDYHSIAAFHDLAQPHEILLKNNIVILEGALLSEIKPGKYTMFCLPINIVGSDGAPARVILTQEH